MPAFPLQQKAACPLPAVAQERHAKATHEEVERMYSNMIERAKDSQGSAEGAGKQASKGKAAQASLTGSEVPSRSNLTTLPALPLPAVAQASTHQDLDGHATTTHEQVEISMEKVLHRQGCTDFSGEMSQVDDVFHQLRKSTSTTEGGGMPSHPGKSNRLSRALQLVVYMAIMISSVQLGLQIDYPENHEFYYWMEIICNSIFVVEMMVKLAHSRSKYFQSGWNIFDFSLVLIAVVDFTVNQFGGSSGSASNLKGLRAIRMLRAVRVLRMLKVFKELWLIVRGIVMSLRAMTWVILLLLMILYMSGILCTMVMEEAGPNYPGYTAIDEIPGGENMEYFNPNEMFGSIPRSMYTLFQLALLTEFSQFGRPIFEKQPEFFPFLVLFIFFVTFGVLNVLIAVIVEVTMEASQNLKQEEGDRKMQQKLALLDQLQQFVFKMDEGSTGSITIQQFAAACQDEDMQKLLVNMGFPVGFTAEELWTLLDQDGNGMLEVEEFVRMAFRMVTCSQEPFQFQCALMSSLNHLQNKVNSVKQEMKSNSETPTSCEKTVIPKTTIIVSRCRSHRQRSRCYIKVHRQHCKLRSRNCHQGCLHAPSGHGSVKDEVESLNGRTPEVKTNPSGTVGAEQVEQVLAHSEHGTGMLPSEMSPAEMKSLLHDHVPEVETKPSDAVSAEQVEQLLANRVHGLLPSEMSPEEIKSLLEWRKHDTGQLKYRELQESVACLAACLDNAEVFKCFMLGMLMGSTTPNNRSPSGIRETQRQAADTHVCHALLQNRVRSNSEKSGDAFDFGHSKI